MRGLLLASVVALGPLISQCQLIVSRYNNVIPNISSLEGRHFKLTVVHDPPGVDVGLNNGVLRLAPVWFLISHWFRIHPTQSPMEWHDRRHDQ